VGGQLLGTDPGKKRGLKGNLIPLGRMGQQGVMGKVLLGAVLGGSEEREVCRAHESQPGFMVQSLRRDASLRVGGVGGVACLGSREISPQRLHGKLDPIAFASFGERCGAGR